MDLTGPVTDGFRSLAVFVPRLVGALLVLLVGYFVAKAVSTLVDKALEKAGFDRAVEKGGIKRALAGSSYDASDVVAKLVFFAIFIPVLSAAIGVLGIAALQVPLAQFIALIPRIIVAIVLVVLGAVVAGAAKSFVMSTIGGLSYGRVLAHAASVLVLVGFVKSALDQVGIATTVTTPLLYTVFATVGGVVVVGVGGGLIKPMQHRWEGILNRAEAETQQVKRQAEAQAQQQQHPSPQYASPQNASPQYVPPSPPQYAPPAAAPYPAEGGAYPVDPAHEQAPPTQQLGQQ